MSVNYNDKKHYRCNSRKVDGSKSKHVFIERFKQLFKDPLETDEIYEYYHDDIWMILITKLCLFGFRLIIVWAMVYFIVILICVILWAVDSVGLLISIIGKYIE